MEIAKGFREVFKIFQNRESYFEEINEKQSNKLILQQILMICVFSFLYGVVMGSYHSFQQSISAGVKVIVLFISTTIICFPSFFIIQQILGSKMSLRQMMVIVLSGLVLSATIVLSFTPIVIFFQVTGGNYHFLQLLHVAIFIFSGFFGLKVMVDALKIACEKKAIYPQIGVTVFKIWIIILTFVGVQLAWNLRPFLSNKNEEFKIFREYEGNFYTAVIYSIRQLTKGPDEIPLDTIKVKTPDTNKVKTPETKSKIDLLDSNKFKKKMTEMPK
jgi:hypothetical protein